MGWLMQLAASWLSARASSYLHPDSQPLERNVNSASNCIARCTMKRNTKSMATSPESYGDMPVASMELARLFEPDLSHQLPPGRLWHLLVIPRSAQ